MTKSPMVNALLAVVYILFVSGILYLGNLVKIGHNSILAPVIAISLFTFSAASMGYIFLYQPFVLYFDNQKKLAVNLFFQTLLYFGICTAILFIIALIFS